MSQLKIGQLYRFKFWVNLFVYNGKTFGESTRYEKIELNSIGMIMPTVEKVDDYECRTVLVNDKIYWLRLKNFTANAVLARVKT